MHTRSFRLTLTLALPVLLLLLGALALQADVDPQSAQADFAMVAAVSTAGTPAPGKLVVAVASGTDEATLIALLSREGATLDRYLPRLGLALVDVPPGDEARATGALAADPQVDFVTGHRKSVRMADVPLDQYFGQQWGMVKAQGPAAWDLAWGDPSVAVAVVDTGVNYMQQDLRDRTWYNPGESAINPATGQRDCSQPISYNGVDDDENGLVDDCRGWNFSDPPGKDPMDGNGHGTAVAGIVAATTNNWDPIIQNYAGVAGMARQARVMALRVFDSYGTGYTFDIAQGMDYATASGAKIINLSLTLVNPNPYDVEMLQRAVAAAQAAGVTVVAAAGNDNYNGIAYPAKFPGVLAVGASTEADTRASFSNYGSRLDLVAPGVGIVSTLLGPGNQSYGRYHDTGSGTSFASPHVAGVAALVRSLRPDLSQSAVYDLISRTADDVGDPGWDTQTGWGRLNAYRAVAEAIFGLDLALVAEPATIPPAGTTIIQLQISAPGPILDFRFGIADCGLAIRNLQSAICNLQSGVPAGFGARVTLAASAGTITPTVVTVDGSGRASVLFSAEAFTGTAEIIATLGGVTATLPVTITSGLPATLELAAAPVRLGAGGRQAIITATVRDEGGSAVSDGAEVAFTTTLGSVSPVTATTTAGRTTTILTSGELTGTATIEATAGGVTGTIGVEILGAGVPFSLTLAADPTPLFVDGPPATITATFFDALGDPVPDGTVVQFTTTRGVLTPTVASTADGQASARLLPGTSPGPARVTATAGGVAGDVAIAIRPGAAVALTLTATPAELVAGYSQVAQLAGFVVDRYGNPVADGTSVAFTASLGIVSPATVTTTNGVAAASFVGELIAGTSAITATTGDAMGHVQVRVRPTAPVSLTLAFAPPKIGVGGLPAGTATFTATVRDTYGNPAEDGTQVEFGTDLGTWRAGQIANRKSQIANDEGRITNHASRITSSVTLTVPSTGGTAIAELVSGPVAGTAHVRVTVTPSLWQTADLPIRPGGPMTITLTANPPAVVFGGRTQLTAFVTDEYGNKVAEGTAVRFVASRGEPRQADVSTTSGVASTWLTADRQPGVISVVVISGNASAFGSVEVTPVRRYVPLVVR
ncbi:MAG: S8 family serine peptidase [Chloroflexi bacterium]|nr:S8 family serine peptidase [Chloroflexota bacterium]